MEKQPKEEGKEPLKMVACPKCGRGKIIEGDKFCDQCGAEIDEESFSNAQNISSSSEEM